MEITTVNVSTVQAMYLCTEPSDKNRFWGLIEAALIANIKNKSRIVKCSPPKVEGNSGHCPSHPLLASEDNTLCNY